MLAAQRVVDIIANRFEATAEPLHVMWYRVEEESRTRFADELRANRGDLAVVPAVVRSPIFVDANAILSDLNRVLADNKDELMSLNLRARQPIAIVMLGREDFRLSQTGSLIQLPDWFPGIGGTEIYVRVRDLLFDVETIRFNAPEARADDLAAHLFLVEAAIVRRIEIVFGKEPKKLDSLWTSIAALHRLPVDRTTVQRGLRAYRNHVDGVSDPRAYRPSLKLKASVLSDLLSLVQRSAPDQLLSVAKSLVPAIGVTNEVRSRVPMIAILLRPTAPMDASERFCHSLLASLFGGYQFLNAAAHASDYPKVSAGFLYLNSRDLRLALQQAAEEMDGLA